MVVDMHGHWGNYVGFATFRADTAGMIRNMDRNKVNLTVISSHRALARKDGNTMDTLSAVKESGGRFLGYWVIHPGSEDDVASDVRAFENHRDSFIGFKIHGAFHQCPLDDPRYRYAFEYADSNRLPVLMHTWHETDYTGYKQVRSVVEKYQKATLLLGHGGFTDFRRFSVLAADNERAFMELCAVYALDSSIEFMVETAGAAKVIFGSDNPWFDPAYGIGCVRYSRISEEEKQMILHDNARGILNSIRCL